MQKALKMRLIRLLGIGAVVFTQFVCYAASEATYGNLSPRGSNLSKYYGAIPSKWNVEDFDQNVLVPPLAANLQNTDFGPSYIGSLYVSRSGPSLCAEECDYFNDAQALKPAGSCGRVRCDFINIYDLVPVTGPSKSRRYICAFFQSSFTNKAAKVQTIALDGVTFTVDRVAGLSRKQSSPNLTCWKNSNLFARTEMPLLKNFRQVTSVSTSTVSSSTSRTSTTTTRTTTRTTSTTSSYTTSSSRTTTTTSTTRTTATSLTTSTSRTSTSTLTITSSTTSTPRAAPSVKTGEDFDLRLDQAIGYLVADSDEYYKQLFPGIDLSVVGEDPQKRASWLAPFFAESSHRYIRRGFWSKLGSIVKTAVKVVVTVAAKVVLAPVKAVIQAVVSLLPAVNKSFGINVFFKLGAPAWLKDVRGETDGIPIFKAAIPIGKVNQYKAANKISKTSGYTPKKLKFDNDIGAEFGLFCKDCYVDTKFVLSGHIAWDHTGMKTMDIGIGGPMELKLGLALKAEGFYNPVLTRQLGKFKLAGLKIPLIMGVGPDVIFSAGWEADLRGYVSLEPTFTLNWDDFKAVAVVVGPSQINLKRYVPNRAKFNLALEAGASLATNVFLEAAVVSSVELVLVGGAEAGYYIRGGVGVGLTAKEKLQLVGEEEKDDDDDDDKECYGIGLQRHWFIDAKIKATASAKVLKLGYGTEVPLYKSTFKFNPTTCYPWKKSALPTTTTTNRTPTSTAVTTTGTGPSSTTITSATNSPTSGSSLDTFPSCQSGNVNGVVFKAKDDNWYETLCGADWPQDSGEISHQETLAQCLDRCIEVNRAASSEVCKGVSFVPGLVSKRTACRLKSSTATNLMSKQLFAVDSIRRLDTPRVTTTCDSDTPYFNGLTGLNGGIYKQRCGWNLAGGDQFIMRSLTAATYDDCINTCTTTSGCKGVQYTKASGSCALLNGIDTNALWDRSDPQGAQYITSFVIQLPMNTAQLVCDGHSPIDRSYMPLTSASSSKKFFVSCNTQFWYNDSEMLQNVSTLQACADVCSQRDDCVGAAWDKTVGYCYLKQAWVLAAGGPGVPGNAGSPYFDSFLLATYPPF